MNDFFPWVWTKLFVIFLCPVLQKKKKSYLSWVKDTASFSMPISTKRHCLYMASLRSEYWGDMDSIVYKSNFYNICIIYENTSDTYFKNPKACLHWQIKCLSWKLHFVCIKMLGSIMGGLCSIQVTETDMIFLFENKIIYDVLSALQFLLSVSSWLHSCCFFFHTFCIIPQLSSSARIVAVSHNLIVTFYPFFPTLFCPPETYKKSNFLIFPLCLLSAELS